MGTVFIPVENALFSYKTRLNDVDNQLLPCLGSKTWPTGGGVLHFSEVWPKFQNET